MVKEKVKYPERINPGKTDPAEEVGGCRLGAQEVPFVGVCLLEGLGQVCACGRKGRAPIWCFLFSPEAAGEGSVAYSLPIFKILFFVLRGKTLAQ